MRNNAHLETDLSDALARLSETERRALVTMLDDDPEVLRQALAEYGYIERDDRGSDSDEFVVNRDSQLLSEPQRELAAHLEGELTTPQSVSDIIKLVGEEGTEYREKYSSAQYRSWLGTQLNALVQNGDIGRFRKGREVYYTDTPQLAVKHWARLNEIFVEDLTIADVVDIREETQMPAKEVKKAIERLTDD